MRFHRLALPLMLVSLSAPAFAQSDMHRSAAKAVPSAAQTSFDKLKTLAGSWEGPTTVDPAVPDVDGKSAQLTLRVASRGHTLMHDLRIDGMPDNPITMLVVDGDRLLLTHYCDADNRPRMVGRASADGKTVEFDFLDISGNLANGHMHHVVFTFVDQDHHIEDWTFMMPGDKPMRAHFDLRRKTGVSALSGR